MAKRPDMASKLKRSVDEPGLATYDIINYSTRYRSEEETNSFSFLSSNLEQEIEFILKGICVQRCRSRFNAGVVSHVQDIIRATKRRAK